MIRPALLSALLLSGLFAIGSVAGEHDRTALSHAIGASVARAHDVGEIPDEAPPAPLTPTVEAPTFGLKERYDVGEPCPATLLLPEGQKLIDVEWELPLQYYEPPNTLATILPFPIGVGSWPVRANYIVDIGGKLSIAKHVETLTVGPEGPPPPPQPLIEIAGPDAPKLAEIYGILSGISVYTSLVQFHNIESTALADPEYGLADNPVVPVIRARLAKIAPFDKAKLIAELRAIAGELGKAPDVVTPVDPVDPDTKATAATYVYEKDDTAIPVGVSTGLNRLNREKNIRATLFEDDTVDGDGDVPDQYKVALEAAIKAGLPAFVVQAGDTVLTVVKSPTTEAQLLEAVR
jgi:hypothetical protein